MWVNHPLRRRDAEAVHSSDSRRSKLVRTRKNFVKLRVNDNGNVCALESARTIQRAVETSIILPAFRQRRGISDAGYSRFGFDEGSLLSGANVP